MKKIFLLAVSLLFITEAFSQDSYSGLYLRPTEHSAGWNTTYLQYVGHSLIVGPPKGGWAHSFISIVPGSSSHENCESSLLLFSSNTSEEYIQRIQIHSNGSSFFNGGYVGIGTTQPQNELDVNGTIRAKVVKVETGWADFVFATDYELPKLADVEAHIKEYKHLPNIPSEAQVKEEGVNIGEMQAKLLQKIEELTLYVIEQDKTIKEQSKLIENLQCRMDISK